MSFYIKKHIQKQCFYIVVLHLRHLLSPSLTFISLLVGDGSVIGIYCHFQQFFSSILTTRFKRGGMLYSYNERTDETLGHGCVSRNLKT
jgi:hypothetical protein